MSLATRMKMREGWVKRKNDPNYKHPRLGKKHSVESRKKISESGKGIKKPGVSEFNSKRVGKLSPNWRQTIGTCIRCKQKLTIVNGKCQFCKQKSWDIKKLYNITIEIYDKITSKCLLCRFKKVVELHHINGRGNTIATGNSRRDNNEKNLVGLCPNHHKLLHSRIYGDETHEKILKILKD